MTSNSQSGVITASSYMVILLQGTGNLPSTRPHIPYVAGLTWTLEFSRVPWDFRWLRYFHNPHFLLTLHFCRFAFEMRTQQPTVVTCQDREGAFVSSVLCSIGSTISKRSIDAVCSSFHCVIVDWWFSTFLRL